MLAAAGVASRRASEELIAEGRVTVDGKVVRVQGMRVDPEQVRIEVDGQRVNVDPRHEYILYNKPPGTITTSSDPQGRPTVLGGVRAKARVYPVGRLDADTLGLLLLTNDGELTHRLTHPRYKVPRIYLAEVRGVPTRETLDQLVEGVRLDDGPARAVKARLRRRTGGRAHIEIVMVEGRKREVRRMFEAVDHPVLALVRIAFGPLRLGDLPTGEYRHLTAPEVGKLKASVGL